MHRLDIISVRLANHNDGRKVEDIFNEICRKLTEKTNNLANAVLYSSSKVNTDWSIHLFCNKSAMIPKQSAMGQSFVDLMGSFGLVNHSIWVVRNDH